MRAEPSLAFLEGGGLDGGGVGQLLVDAQIDLFAGDLGGQQAGRDVGGLVGGIEPGPLRHQRGQPRLEVVDARAVRRRDHEDLGIDAGVEQGPGQGQQGVAAHQVDLVERQDGLLVGGLQALDDGLHVLDGLAVGGPALAIGDGDLGLGVDQVDDGVGVLGPAPGGADHGPVEPAARLEDAGRVDQHDLAVALHGHAAHRKAGGLDLLGDDGDLGPDQAVDQGRLAGVGRADHRGEAGAGHSRCLALQQRRAAAFSATCSERPAGARPGSPRRSPRR